MVYFEHPELAWQNYFYNQDKSQRIRLVSTLENGNIRTEISCEEREKSLNRSRTPIRDEVGEELVPVIDSSVLAEVGNSKLRINAQFGQQSYLDHIEYSWRSRIESRGRNRFQTFNYTIFIPTGYKRPGTILARDFERARLRGRASTIVNAFKIVDNSIDNVDVVNLGEPKIIISRTGYAPQPLNYFGDALNKIADIVLRIENSRDSILLIDEIENGIHHTNQEEFWQMLMRIANENGVQIFCTSHSGEMINAFKKAAVSFNGQNEACYFELIKSARAGEIVANAFDFETLDYNIKTNHPYRGE